MKIRKGELLKIKSSRKGTYIGRATEDFDTEKDEWYPVVVAQSETIIGMRDEWVEGEEIPCRRGLDKVEIIKEDK